MYFKIPTTSPASAFYFSTPTNHQLVNHNLNFPQFPFKFSPKLPSDYLSNPTSSLISAHSRQTTPLLQMLNKIQKYPLSHLSLLIKFNPNHPYLCTSSLQYLSKSPFSLHIHLPLNQPIFTPFQSPSIPLDKPISTPSLISNTSPSPKPLKSEDPFLQFL